MITYIGMITLITSIFQTMVLGYQMNISEESSNVSIVSIKDEVVGWEALVSVSQ